MFSVHHEMGICLTSISIESRLARKACSRIELKTSSYLQNAMKKVVKGVGGLSHSEWRAFRDQRVSGRPSSNFIDGDLVEQYLDLRQDQMQTVVSHMGGGMSAEELGRTVEELSRALH